ncbi:MAG: hypothetical protein ACOY0T_21005 [Myxococcota bacterium]
MQTKQPIHKGKPGEKQRRLDQRPPRTQSHPKLPFEGTADEHASKSDFPGEADQRSADDKDGNAEQARTRRRSVKTS